VASGRFDLQSWRHVRCCWHARLGERYSAVVVATFGGGSVTLQTLAADGAMWVPLGTAITASGNQTYDLPPASYRFAITTATAVYASITTVPLE